MPVTQELRPERQFGRWMKNGHDRGVRVCLEKKPGPEPGLDSSR